MKIKSSLVIVLSMLLLACQPNAKKLLINKDSKELNFTTIETGEWETLCLFNPYTTDSRAEELLNIDWPTSKFSSINLNDGIVLAVFLHKEEVITFYELNRTPFDFTSVGDRCYSRNNALFKLERGKAIHQTG